MNNMIPFSPLQQLWRMQHEVDRLFDGLLPHGKDKTDTAVWSPRVDLSESDHAYQMIFDLPGVSKDDVAINFHDGVLSVSGESSRLGRDDANAILMQRRTGQFYREFKLPKSVDAQQIEASCENGVLTVRIPKNEASKPRQIKVK